MIERLPISPEHRVLLVQLLRYGVTGGFVTLFGVSAYALGVRGADLQPLIANVLAYLVSMVLGYFLHGRFSFRGHGSSGDASMMQGGKFFITSGVSFVLNSLFVWLFTHVFHWDELTPILAMIFITPLVCFVIYRKWVFA